VKNGLVVATTLGVLVTVLCTRAQASTCVLTANATSAEAFTRAKQDDFADAGRLYQQAAVRLESCLHDHRSELTISSNYGLARCGCIPGTNCGLFLVSRAPAEY
jgi:hypothetical protein